jgi:hypothetical protein
MAIRIKYAGFWKGFKHEDEPLLYQHIAKKHNIKVVDKNPDIVFIGRRTKAYLTEKEGLKVFYSAERYEFDEKHFDFSISFQPDSETNLFLPNYIRRYGFDDYLSFKNPYKLDWSKKKKFACFIHNNCRPRFRKRFLHLMNQYSEVECSGKCFNNIGSRAPDGEEYFEFISQYKFMITFENFKQPNYSTEKIYNALRAGVVPIYWGDPNINEYFNKDIFINTMEFKNFKQAVKYVQKVNEDDKLYESFFNKPRLNNVINPEKFDNFFDKIVNSI